MDTSDQTTCESGASPESCDQQTNSTETDNHQEKAGVDISSDKNNSNMSNASGDISIESSGDDSKNEDLQMETVRGDEKEVNTSLTCKNEEDDRNKDVGTKLSQDSGLEIKIQDSSQETKTMKQEHRSADKDEDESSDSSTDSDSSDSGAEADSSTDEEIRKARDANKATKKNNNNDGDDTRIKGELYPEDLPPLEDLRITVEDDVPLQLVGRVKSAVGVLVIVEGVRDEPALDQDTVLFLEDRKDLGAVFEVFGPVACPFYSVRFNSVEDITEKGVTEGVSVFCAPTKQEYTHYVFTEQLKKIKGSDASWEHDIEPPSQFLQYSDDEDEKRARVKLRERNMTDEQIEKKKQKNMMRKMKRNEKMQDGNGQPKTPPAPRWPPGPPTMRFNQPPPRFVATPPPWRLNRPRPPWLNQQQGPGNNFPQPPNFGGPPNFGQRLAMQPPANQPPWQRAPMGNNPWNRPPPPGPPIGHSGNPPPWLKNNTAAGWGQPPPRPTTPPWHQAGGPPPPQWGQPPTGQSRALPNMDNTQGGAPSNAIVDTRFVNKQE